MACPLLYGAAPQMFRHRLLAGLRISPSGVSSNRWVSVPAQSHSTMSVPFGYGAAPDTLRQRPDSGLRIRPSATTASPAYSLARTCATPPTAPRVSRAFHTACPPRSAIGTGLTPTAAPLAVVRFASGMSCSAAPGPRRYWNFALPYAASPSIASLVRWTTFAPCAGWASPARPTLKTYVTGWDWLPALSLAVTVSVRTPSSGGVTVTSTGPVALTVVAVWSVSSW
jgi:hypothetical protein